MLEWAPMLKVIAAPNRIATPPPRSCVVDDGVGEVLTMRMPVELMPQVVPSLTITGWNGAALQLSSMGMPSPRPGWWRLHGW